MLGILREQSLRLIISYARMDDNIFTLLPVNGSSDTVLVASLESCSVGIKMLLALGRWLGSYNQAH